VVCSALPSGLRLTEKYRCRCLRLALLRTSSIFRSTDRVQVLCCHYWTRVDRTHVEPRLRSPAVLSCKNSSALRTSYATKRIEILHRCIIHAECQNIQRLHYRPVTRSLRLQMNRGYFTTVKKPKRNWDTRARTSTL
jgi:hypothetical protein